MIANSTQCMVGCVSLALILTGPLTHVVAQKPNATTVVPLVSAARVEVRPKGMVCVFEATIATSTDEAGRTKDGSKKEHRELVVFLSDDYFLVTGSVSTVLGSGLPPETDDDTIRVYNLADRVLQIIHPSKKSYNEISMYAIANFRIVELIHRQGLLASLDVTSIPKRKLGGPTTQYGLETMFGLLSPGSQSQLKAPSEQAGLYEFTHKGLVVLAYRNSHHEIPETLRPSFRRLLSYEFPIHPAIRTHVATQARLPQEMSILYISDAGTREIGLRLKSVRRETPTRFLHPLSDRQLVRSNVPEIRELLDKLAEKPVPTLKQSQQNVSNFVNASIRDERFLDGVLACLEFIFQTGDNAYAGQLMRRLQRVAADDAKTEQFFDAISGKSQAIRKLRESNGFEGYQKLHVMDYMLGDKLLAEGAADEAHQYITKALAGNPWLVGAYVDLARIYIKRSDYPSGWQLFRAAQSVSPTHQDVRPVIALEEKLTRDLPDFFYRPTRNAP